MSSGGMDGFASWVLLAIDDHWQTLLVAAIVVALIGAGAAVVTADDPGVVTEERVGTLTVAVDLTGEPTTEGVGYITVPAEGAVPATVADRLTVSAAVEVDEGAPIDPDRLSLSASTRRDAAAGTLWAHTAPLAVTNGSAPLRTSAPLELPKRLAEADRIDTLLGTTSGQVAVEVTAQAYGAGNPIERATLTVQPRGDHLRLDEPVQVPIVAAGPIDPERPSLMGYLAAGGGLLSVVLAGMRLSGLLPLPSVTRAAHRRAALRWRYRHRLVDQREPVALDDVVDLETPGSVLRIAAEAGRPARIDPSGTLAVTVDGQTYAWWSSPSLDTR